MTNPYEAPGTLIAETRTPPETTWRWLAWSASALSLVPVGLLLSILFDDWRQVSADALILFLFVLFGLPWLITGACLAMLRKMALWPLLLLTLMTGWVWGFNMHLRDPSVALGYTLAMLAIVLWLRKRRALV
ncbi:hypothetical protein [Noviluteimonas gilva]|uniref:Uncharacterized protein n=1 Tax=Noviluteimonas gilva TaxID=2682097 RepID=A0A7C9HMN8_9GAMM|nr:hypothetical protein [Lysobacter gilvus]MUV14652.1 hypothetical protein [Lysobacter gilvus]